MKSKHFEFQDLSCLDFIIRLYHNLVDFIEFNIIIDDFKIISLTFILMLFRILGHLTFPITLCSFINLIIID